MSRSDEHKGDSIGLGDRLRRGDESVLPVILEHYGAFISQALKIRYPVLNEQDLEDALSTALFNLWNARDRYSADRGSLKNWFFMIARNVASDLARDKGLPSQQIDWESLPDSDVEQKAVAPADSAMRGRLLALISTLKDEELRLLLEPTRSIEGQWTETLSHEWGIDAGTLRVRRSRLLKRLRAALMSPDWNDI